MRAPIALAAPVFPQSSAGTSRAQRRAVRSLPLLPFLLFASVAAQAQVCVETPDVTGTLAADVRGAVSYRAGEAPVPFTKQKATLDEILRRMRRRQEERKSDPTLPKLVVMIDLDNTSFVPTARVRAGLARIASQYGIVEAADPDSFDLLPHYSKPGFLAWAEKTGLRANYPALDWNLVYSSYNGASWNVALDGTETLTPGLVKFARRVSQNGGVVVFNTGRRETKRVATEETLKKGGIANPKVTMKPDSGFPGSTAEWKVEAAKKIGETWGEPIALVDETAINHDTMKATFPDMMGVAINLPGYTTEMTDDELAAEPWAISTFER